MHREVETVTLRPDFYIAAIGRSGSTALSNWLTREPDELVFNEPFFLRPRNSRLLRIQLENFGMAVGDDEWNVDDSGMARFERLMAPRLAGKRWAAKEVLTEEHLAFLEAFSPPRVIITVRNIVDIALSFFEKHRIQDNLDRFSDEWVVDYCKRETAGILAFRERLQRAGIPYFVVRYEDLIRSNDARRGAANFVGWRGGGQVDAHLDRFDRQFEANRHGSDFSGNARRRGDRALEKDQRAAADLILSHCRDYQSAFGYS